MKNSKLIITIAGRPGSGKSSTAKGVAKKLGFDHFSSGDLFRKIATEQNIDVLEANQAAEKEDDIPKIDYLVDERLREIAKTEEKIVIDSRMAWHWMPDSFKVFLDLDLAVAAERILADMTPERIKAELIPESPDQYAKVLEDRLASEARRYKKIYNVNPYDMKNYDLVVDTATNNLEEVIEIIVEGFKKRNV